MHPYFFSLLLCCLRDELENNGSILLSLQRAFTNEARLRIRFDVSQCVNINVTCIRNRCSLIHPYFFSLTLCFLRDELKNNGSILLSLQRAFINEARFSIYFDVSQCENINVPFIRN